MIKVLHVGAENSIIVSHLITMLAKYSDTKEFRQGVVVYGNHGRKELAKLTSVARHARPGTEKFQAEQQTNENSVNCDPVSWRRKLIVQMKQWNLLSGDSALRNVLTHMRLCLRRGAWKKIFVQYDILNLQGMFWGVECEAALRIWRGKLVVSIWGSDLLRVDDLSVLKKQKLLLEKADVITCSGVEFREIVLAKFGRHLKSKIKPTYFSIGGNVTDFILNHNRTDAKLKWNDRLQLDSDKRFICVGHNGNEANNHIPIISALAALSSEVKKKTHVVLPMTYSLSSLEYKELVLNELKKSSLSGTILDHFLSDNEVAELRLASDVFIYGAESDAFSATVSQALMAQNVVICAAWLPYGERRRYGFDYLEFDEFSRLSEVLTNVIENYEVHSSKAQKNKELSISFFDNERLSREWIKVYETAEFVKRSE